MKSQLQINGSYKLTTALLGAVVIVAVLTGIFARSMAATSASSTEAATATPTAGEASDSNGRADESDDNSMDQGTEAPTEADFAEDLPETCGNGSAEECSFQAGNVALLTRGAAVDFDETTGVAVVEGSVTIPTNGVDVEIENGDLEIQVADNGEIVNVSGTSDVPLPTEGPLAAAAVVDGARAEVGYDWGRNLTHLGAHVNPDRQYFFFTFEDSFSMETGFDQLFGDVAGLPLSLSAPGDVSVTMVLDPLDPFLYIGGACPDFGPDKKNNQDKTDNGTEKKNDEKDANDEAEKGEVAYGQDAGEDCGLGVSLGGHIPFEAQVDNGARADLQTFFGHIVIDHSEIPLTTGVTLDGELVVRIGEDALAFGGNGDIRASVPLVDDVLDFSFPLAKASSGMKMGLTRGGEKLDLFLSGSMDSQSAFDKLPDWLPLEAPVDARVSAAARLVLNFNGDTFIDPASFVELEGEIAMVPSFLSDLTGVDLSQLLVSEAAVRIDSTGVRMQGRTSSSIHPAVKLGGAISVDAFVSPANLAESFIALDGELQVGAIDLAGGASLRLDSTGFRATGHVTTPLSQIEVTGLITTTEVALMGKAEVEVPLNLLGDLLDGAPKALADAKEEVRKLDSDIQAIRDEINADREQRTRDFDAAQAAVDTAKAEVDEIQGEINAAYRRIRTLKNEMADWDRWYENLPPWEKATGWIGLGAEKGWRAAEVGLLYTGIGTLEVARGVAQLALDGAKLVLDGVEAGLDLIPVDADPRIIALTAAREIALGALTVAEGAVAVLTIDASIAAEVEVYVGTGGVSGSVSGQACGGGECLELIGGSVNFGAQPEACFTVAGIEACVGF